MKRVGVKQIITDPMLWFFHWVSAIDEGIDGGKEMHGNHLLLKDSSVAVHSSKILLVFG